MLRSFGRNRDRDRAREFAVDLLVSKRDPRAPAPRLEHHARPAVHQRPHASEPGSGKLTISRGGDFGGRR